MVFSWSETTPASETPGTLRVTVPAMPPYTPPVPTIAGVASGSPSLAALTKCRSPAIPVTEARVREPPSVSSSSPPATVSLTSSVPLLKLMCCAEID